MYLTFQNKPGIMAVCIFECRSQNDRVHEHMAERNVNVRFIKGAMRNDILSGTAVKLNRIQTADTEYHRQKRKKKAHSDL